MNAAPSSAPTTQTVADPAAEPILSYPDYLLLAGTVRRAIGETLKGRTSRPPRFVPLALQERTASLLLTLRHAGRAIVREKTAEDTLLSAGLEGGGGLAKELQRRYAHLAERNEQLGLEIEIIGSAEVLPIELTKEGHWPPALYACFERGIHGVGVEFGGRRGVVTPGVILAANYTPDLALEHAELQAKLTVTDKRLHGGKIRYFRFQTVHLWQETASSRPIRLQRGVVVVPGEAVDAAGLDRAVAELAAYMRYRRNHDGAFSYCYVPSSDRYDDRNSATAQMVALASLLEYGRRRPDSLCSEAARPLFRATLGNLRPLPESKDALFISFEGHEDKLGTTAEYLCATLHAETDATTGDVRRKLANAIIGAQGESGQIGVDDAIAGRPTGSANLAAGRALEALATYAAACGDERAITVLHRAAGHYRAVLAASEETDAVATHASAFARGYALNSDPLLADLAFELTDRLAAAQERDATRQRPELAGAIDLGRGGRFGIATADGCAALADGVALARRTGDSRRADQYERALRGAARFVMQLQFRPEECTYVRSRQDAVGGVRSALWNSTITIENCARALRGLVRARTALFGDWPTSQAATRPATSTPAATGPAGPSLVR